MSIILSVHSTKAFQEFLLPATNNSEHFVILDHDIFSLDTDIELRLEVIEHFWHFLDSGSYRLEDTVSREECFGRELKNGDLLTVILPSQERISIMVDETVSSFKVFEKYDIRGIGEITIGKNETNDIVYDTRKLVSREHAVIRKSGTQCVMEDRSANGVFIGARRIVKSKQLDFGDCINIFGLSLVYLGDILAVNSQTEPFRVNQERLKPVRDMGFERMPVPISGGAGRKILYRRSPRQIYKPDSETFEIEAPPQPRVVEKKSIAMLIGPSLTMALPMLLGCGMAVFSAKTGGASGGVFMYTGLVTAVASAVIGLVWAIVNLNAESRKQQEEEQHRIAAYSAYLAKCESRIRDKYEKNRAGLQAMYLSAEENGKLNAQSALLWNRNASHHDCLAYRLGTGDMPFQAKISVPKERFNLVSDSLAEKPAMIQKAYRMLQDVPICVDFQEHRVIGLVGGAKKRGAVAVMHALVAQIAVSSCYTDVKMAFLYDEGKDDAEDWAYLKWLPHVWSEDKKSRYVAKNRIEAGDVLYEITKTLRNRSESRASSFAKKDKLQAPQYILFVADPKWLEGELIAKYITDENNRDVSTVFLTDSYENLPNECTFMIQNDAHFQGMYAVEDNMEDRKRISFDSISNRQLEKLARTLANIEVHETESGGDIPESLTFFDMYGVRRPEELHVLDKWRKNRTYDSMKALIGQKAGGSSCYLDVHEKYHGPHGLVAGTTGSGKSETLQTYILSLALNFSPDDVGFFLIDYKGGGMANLFQGLPHIIGQISNLSGNQVRRAMVSIKSENKRRQRIFNEHGVNNINLYTRLYKNNEASVPVPHLFIVIDEFAELKREEPDFMRELISVAQVGRSLGVHLILATQKPAGTVDDNIWSNSKFRLCLRVQDRQDSNDMLHRPDAAYITQAGRGYMQVGNDELFELFQSGFSGAAYDEEDGGRRLDIAHMLSTTGKMTLVGNRSKRKKNAQKQKTQLDAVVEFLAKLAQENGYVHALQLWLPALPKAICLSALPTYREADYFDGNVWQTDRKEWNIEVLIGLYDDPVNQTQGAYSINLSRNGHHAVVGTAACGKSTLLQTFLYGLTSRYTPEEVNVYAIDFSANMLSAFEKMPHTGGVMYESDTDKPAKFFDMLHTILEERKRLLKGGSYSQYVRANGIVLPAIVLVIDNYSNFQNKTNHMYEDMILKISKDGVSNGIFLVITAGGFGAQEIPHRIGDNLRTVICLEMSDKFQYAEAMRTMHIETLPEVNVAGRGLARVGEQLLEFQTALSFDAEDDFGRMERMGRLAKQMQERWTGKKARPIPEIPENPLWTDYEQLEDAKGLFSDDRHLPIGYNMKNAAPYGIDLSRTYCYLIAGKSRSGKTNLLKVMVKSALLRGGKVTVIDYNGEMAGMAEQESLSWIDTDEKAYQYFSDLLPKFKERNVRKKANMKAGMSDEEIYADMRSFPATYIFIANFADFVTHVMNPGDVGDVRGFVENVLDKGSYHNVFWAACYDQEDAPKVAGTRIYECFLRYKTGIHFGGNVAGQRIMNFDYLPYSEQTKAQKPGIGMLPSNEYEDVRMVAVPLVKG